MSYDAARINELLAQLQNSSAFQNTVAPTYSVQQPTAVSLEVAPPANSLDYLSSVPQAIPTPQSSVFELLSRLNSGASSASKSAPPRSNSMGSAIQSKSTDSTSAPDKPSPGLDLRYMTVQQALPHISKLSQRADFRDKIKKMHDTQNQLEQSLYSDQQGVLSKHEERVTYARNRANIIGEPIGDKENEELALQLETDLKKFHSTRVLVAWDAQRTKQQSQLEVLGVPCMFVTSDPAALQRQQKVLRILLESINESEDMPA